jgi:hypothetical protein
MVGTIAVVLVLFGLFCYGIYQFRFAPKEEAPTSNVVPTVTDVLTPSPVTASALQAQVTADARTAELRDVTSNVTIGHATRGEKDKHYYFTLNTDLPEIDRERFFYEGWILRKVPYDYVSVGDLVTNDEGKFVLEWEADVSPEIYAAYTTVIVTLEARDGNPDPSTHVLRGVFE